METEQELEGAIGVRFRVFVAEQSVPPEEELDDADATATHAVAISQDKVIGTGRLIAQDESTAIIGRMAVDLEWRRHGVGGPHPHLPGAGSPLPRPASRPTSTPRNTSRAFYASHGYEEHGDVFLEVGIPHIEMRKGL